MRLRHTNADMEGLLFLFKEVEKGAMSACEALARFSQSFGGYQIYVPSTKRIKGDDVIALLEAGASPEEAARKVGVTLVFARRLASRNNCKKNT